MSRCTAAERSRARRCADALDGLPMVEQADLLAPADSSHDRWTVDILLTRAAAGLHPQVERELALYGLTARQLGRQGTFWQAVATV
jgi:hypothetical protein